MMWLPWRRVHFTGAGGVGMAGLAHILADLGIEVTGSDEQDSTMLRTLRIRGLDVVVGHDAAVIDGADLVVYSNAIPVSNVERREAEKLGIPTCLRGDFLAKLCSFFDCVVAVGGSHGKTTTSAMVAHILTAAGKDPAFLVGGEIIGWARSAGAGGRRLIVTEVDESDGTQAGVRSTCAVVTNVDDDHAWSVGGIGALQECFRQFASQASEVICWEEEGLRGLFSDLDALTAVDMSTVPSTFRAPVPGEYNLRNAALAVEASVRVGVGREEAWRHLESFAGVGRRFRERFVSADGRLVVVEDYAHHPTELRAAMIALRDRYPVHRQCVVFQPHRYERITHYAAEFGEILSSADQIVVTSPFSAWLDDGKPDAVSQIVDAVRGHVVYADCDPMRLPALTLELLSSDGSWVVSLIGAGSIGNCVEPFVRLFRQQGRELLVRDFSEEFPGLLCSSERSWAELTTLGIGVDRPFLVSPRTLDELQRVLALAVCRGIEPFVLGGGSNLVGTDLEPVRVVVSLTEGEFNRMEVCSNSVRVGAGVRLHTLVSWLVDRKLAPEGLVPLAWVPGTLGGAIRMNAGCGGHSIGDYVVSVHGVLADTPTQCWDRDAAEIDWSYRATDLPENLILTHAMLRLSDSDKCRGTRDQLIQSRDIRKASQPTGRSAGCAFRNTPDGISAGKLLDDAGCKGMSENGLSVSRMHANFVVKQGEGTETGVVTLLARMQQAVLRQIGRALCLEVKFVSPETEAVYRRLTDTK